MASRFLLPDGELSDGVRAILSQGDWMLFSEAQAGADVSSVEFYVPPYLAWSDAVDVLGRLPRLRVVQVVTAGIDWIAPHVPSGVMLCRGVGVHEASVAELVLASVLALTKEIPTFVRNQALGLWGHQRIGGLRGKRAAVLGYGEIGRTVGGLLEAFGVHVMGISRGGRAPSSTLADARSYLRETDLFVVALPLTEETRGLVDREVLGVLPDGALVVNVSRGPVIESGALERELVTGRLRAALDVTDPEPLPSESPLWRLPNVLITPHVGGDSELFPQLAAELVAGQLRRYLNGRPLEHQVVGEY